MAEGVIRVRIAEFKVAAAPSILKIIGLGSCVALALHDPGSRIGGLAHVLLPGPAPEEDLPGSLKGFKYADRAVAELIRMMERQNGDRKRMVARITGGANMFQAAPEMGNYSGVRSGIGERNVEAVLALLREAGIPVVGQEVGGSHGRSVLFETATGKLIISGARGPRRFI